MSFDLPFEDHYSMHRVLVNVMASDWAVHFIAPDGHTRIGPWLLHDSHDEPRRWSCSPMLSWQP